MPRFAASALVLFSLGCGKPPEVSHPTPAALSQDSRYLAWFQVDDRFVTYDFRTGQPAEPHDGLFLLRSQPSSSDTPFANLDLAQLRLGERRIPKLLCDEFGDMAATNETFSVTTVEVLQQGEGHLLHWPGNDWDNASHWGDRVTFVGSVRSMIAVEIAAESNLCGAHSDYDTQRLWYDVAGDALAPTPVTAPSCAWERITETAERLHADLAREMGEPYDYEIYETGILPTFANGSTSFRVFVAVPAPWASSEGGIGYMKESEFTVPCAPDELRDLPLSIPTPVLEFASQHPELRLGGVAEVRHSH